MRIDTDAPLGGIIRQCLLPGLIPAAVDRNAWLQAGKSRDGLV
ncbi:MAG: hypothetical protein ACK4N6_05340 [Rhodocyclaceae bacterium]